MIHGIILGQSSTPVERIDLEGHRTTQMLTFEVASFDIGYNCILRRPFLLKFMVIIHTVYATLKMHGPKCVITIKDNQCDTIAYENTILTHVG
jgi:hypothetical protein